MFQPSPSSRAVLKSGTIYAVSGEAGWIYYAQVTPDKRMGFFHFRTTELADLSSVLSAPLMAVLGVNYPSVTRALRSGAWLKLGGYELANGLRNPLPLVHWPVGTLIVSVWEEGSNYDTRVEDPRIQNMEIAASLDAELHIPERLTADFGEEVAAWYIGGPIWRERKVREEYSSRFPDAPWHQLPEDWVPTRKS